MIALPEFADARGRLVFGQEGQHIPFAIKRIFMLHDIAEGAQRADHAHRRQEQFVLMVSGQCRIVIRDGTSESEEWLRNPTAGFYVPPITWIALDRFSPGAVCLVLASGAYDEADYIRDYAEFQALALLRQAATPQA
jgi:hypothetical protein